MSGHEHLTPATLEQLLGSPRMKTERLVDAASHLARRCPDCWAALRTTCLPAPTWDDPQPPSPLREALVRQMSPTSWPEVSSDLLEALLRAPDEMGGFAVVVTEVAAGLSETSWEPLSQAIGFAEHLAQAPGSIGFTPTLLARLHAIRAKGHVHRCSQAAADRALVKAARFGVGDDVPARIHLAEARGFFAWRFGGPNALPDARGLFHEALDLARPERPLRALEILILLASLKAWSPSETVRHVAEALERGAALRGDTSPERGIVRAHALLRSANLLVTALDRGFFGEVVPSFVRGLADELEAAEDLFESTSGAVKAQRFLVLAHLSSFPHAPHPNRPDEALLRRAATELTRVVLASSALPEGVSS